MGAPGIEHVVGVIGPQRAVDDPRHITLAEVEAAVAHGDLPSPSPYGEWVASLLLIRNPDLLGKPLQASQFDRVLDLEATAASASPPPHGPSLLPGRASLGAAA